MLTEEELVSKPTNVLNNMSKSLAGVFRSETSMKRRRIISDRMDLIKTILRNREGDEVTSQKSVNRVRESIPVEVQARVDLDSQISLKYNNLYSNAKNRNLQFTLTLSDVRYLLKRKTCAYTGMHFVHETGHRLSPSVERLDQTRGYTKDNTVMICLFANELKNMMMEDTSSRYYMNTSELNNFVRNSLCTE